MIEDKTIVYNISEDDWELSSECMEEVLQQKLDDMSSEEILEADNITLYKGVINKVTFSRYVNVASILASMAEWAYDYNEFAEGYLDDVTDEQKKDLTNVICEWAKRYNIEPHFFEVDSIEEVVVELTEDMKKELLDD
jgi:lysyl-tRNA synthetase class I